MKNPRNQLNLHSLLLSVINQSGETEMNYDNEMPDFSKYSIGELEDIVSHIDKIKYPDRFSIAIEILEKKKSEAAESGENENNELGFVEKYFEHLKWTIGIYHIFFASWAAFLFFRLIQSDIKNLLYTLPLILLLVTSITGSILLFSHKKNSYNFLIAAQIPQIVILQLNGFVYYLLIGQWILIKLSGIISFSIEVGLWDIKYAFVWGNANNTNFLLGINLLPIILINILLKMEKIEKTSSSSSYEATSEISGTEDI